jgi:hypothetical protein
VEEQNHFSEILAAFVFLEGVIVCKKMDSNGR